MIDNPRDTVLKLAGGILPEVINIRRHIHMHPELSYREEQTSAFVSGYLGSLGIENITGVAGTGVVGIIRGGMPGKGLTIGLRADMDALPVTEDAGRDYGSTVAGVMHACGHDAHVAMLLGTATLLQSMKEHYCGTVLLVFQPGEEKAPGGARLMIETGIFDSYEPDAFIAQHVLPELPSGVIGYHSGPYMASCDEIYITVKGRGGHAAQPSLYTDQLYITSELIIALKDTIGRIAEEKAPTVFALGNITGKGATNIIPEKVEVAGTFRTFDESWRGEAKEILRSVAADMAKKRGVEIDMNIVEGYPVMTNDPALAERAMQLTRELTGIDGACEVPQRMGSEDFSFFSVRYPSLLFRLGITPAGAPQQRLHSPSFDIDETAMVNGVANMAWLTLNMFKEKERFKK